MRRILTSLVFLALVLAAWATPVSNFSEDFSTTAYRDVANTTAWWDNTGSQSLKLNGYASEKLSETTLAGVRDVEAVGYLLYAITSVTYHIYEASGTPMPGYTAALVTDGREIEVDGDLTYVADGTGGLRVIYNDIGFGPSLLGTFATIGIADGLDVDGDRAFVCTTNGYLQVVNVQNPAAMASVSLLYLGASIAYNCDIEGDVCYVADGTGGVKIIDVSNPGSPSLLTTYPAPDAREVVVQGNYAFIADATSSFLVLDISNPASPVLVHSFSSVVGLRVAVDGNVGLLGTTSQVLDIENPISNWPANSITTGQVSGIDIAGDRAFIADIGNGKIVTIEIREPSPMYVEGSVDPGNVEDVVVRGNVLYGAGAFDFYSIDVSDPTNPVPLDTLVLPDIAGRHDVDGNLAVVPVFDSGVAFVDVSDPSAMVIIGNYDSPGIQYYDAVDIVGDIAYVGVDDDLEVLNIQDPTLPTLLATLNMFGSQMAAVVVKGDYAYLAAGTAGLYVVDISDPSAPTVAGQYDTPNRFYDIAVNNNIVYAADDIALAVVGVTDPTNPNLFWSIATANSFTNGITMSANKLFLSVDNEGISVYDLSNSSIPTFEEKLGNGTDPRRLAVQGDVLYAGMRFDGLDVISMRARDFDVDDWIGQSTNINSTGDDVHAVKVSTQQTGANEWIVTNDGGSTWLLLPLDQWLVFPTPDKTVYWRTGLVQDVAHVNPSVSQIDVSMAFAYPVIQTIEDIPNDQGKQVRISWQFSGYDILGSATPIHYYDVYRQIDPNLVSTFEVPAGSSKLEAPVAAAPGWDFVGTAPANGDNEYSLVVPTLADSTLEAGLYQTTYFVRARSAVPTTYFDSPTEGGYSVDNLSPSVPLNLAVSYATGSGNQLSWDPAPEPDWKYFKVYRDVTPDFTPGSTNFVEGTTNTAWTDPSHDTGGVYYKLTSVDFSGNESGPATGGVASGITPRAAPLTFALRQNTPNPFNPTTTIRYDVPAVGSHVSVIVFDISGRVVRVLVDGQQSGGTKSVVWDGHTDAGRSAASGIYFYRMHAGEFNETRKMMLLK